MKNNLLQSVCRRSFLVILLFLGTVALTPAAELKLTNFTWSAQGFQIAWTNLGTGTSYTVQARERIVDSLWLEPEASQPWPTATNRWTDTNVTSSLAKFYRVLGVPSAERGKILRVATNNTYTPFTITVGMQFAGIPITPETTPQYSLRLMKVNYETVSAWGARIRASGALAIPIGVSQGLPLASYQHGTITRTNDAPSVNPSGEAFLGVVFASTGYATVVPDYIGLGESEGIQEYHHARSEATACIDMMRAARRYCSSNNIALNGKVFLCGYSHGGHATMALLRELEAYHTNEFTVTACAPMAGAYDLSGATTDDFLAGHTVPNPYYFALLLAAYEDVYHLAPSLSDLLVPPYTTNLPPLLNGNTTGGAINAVMPNPPTAILKPEILESFRTNQNHLLRQALWDNDLYRWTPRAPMRMYHCGADQDVVIMNSSNALSSFLARGCTNVTLIVPSPTLDHGGCVEPSLTAAKAWFDSLR